MTKMTYFDIQPIKKYHFLHKTVENMLFLLIKFNFARVQPLLCVRRIPGVFFFTILRAHLTAKDAVKIPLGYQQVLVRVDHTPL